MQGIFTTIRVCANQAWFFEDHLERLGLDASLRDGVLGAAEPFVDARVRVTLLPGKPPRIEAQAYAPPERPWRLRPVAVSPDRDRVRFKTVERAMYDKARREAGDADDALLHLPDGTLLECTVANLFVVVGRRLLTPPQSAPLLAGIARRQVLGAAGKLGLTAAEEALTLKSLRRADGCFVTNALMVAHPVGEVCGHKRYESVQLARHLRELLIPRGVQARIIQGTRPFFGRRP